ncbi:type I glyceraldehyde-3-phosphate dehydrogenase [Fluviispira multicolorata]|uniref:Type I glyceraldehyde-3-phosphate dehydrogenase n=1 Tax=Fluviispira multicolorata TaxID=2654512 RepID=A0A833JGP3_9BACT|nr:type I glyceraldehyde-3-phosphate dehydrogenase [Fluviispira multicolorata]KAB8032231.1 type I glyceraldehyde-3-phosphate dehydrogenase [Fluviispira multicolorata]
MTIKVGINGFGRIGRCVLRALKNERDIEVCLINDLTDAKTLAHLYKYDSIHGKAEQVVETKESSLVLDGKEIKISAIRNPAEIPWAANGVDIVLECTGLFTDGEKASAHLKGGAKKVILSAPGKSIDKTIVIGVNDEEYDIAKHNIISNGSCTTNCLAPLTKVIHEKFVVKKGLMTTIHSYTNDQNILDLPHKDLRRARAAALSMIPTTTGAAKAISEVIPSLAGKLNGFAVRVPTPNVSLVDVTFELEKSVTAKDINSALKSAAEGSLKGILGYSEEPLVSCDYNGCTNSSTIDAEYTTVIGENMVKVLSWYDNEAGFSNRMVQLTRLVATGKL